MEHDDPEAFGKVVDWIFGSTVISCSTATCPSRPSRHKPYDAVKENRHVLDLCKLYVLSKKFRLEILANAAANQFSACGGWLRDRIWKDGVQGSFYSPELIKYIYAETEDSSPLRSTISKGSLPYLLCPQHKTMITWGNALNANSTFAADTSIALKRHTRVETCDIYDCDIHDE